MYIWEIIYETLYLQDLYGMYPNGYRIIYFFVQN